MLFLLGGLLITVTKSGNETTPENHLTPLLEVGQSNGKFGSTLDSAFQNFGKEYLTHRE